MDAFAVAAGLDPAAGLHGCADGLLKEIANVFPGFDQLDMPLIVLRLALSVVGFSSARYLQAMDLSIVQRKHPRNVDAPRPFCRGLSSIHQSLHSQNLVYCRCFDALPGGLAASEALLRLYTGTDSTALHTISRYGLGFHFLVP